ncbi:RagB/SusD family nutrient uptake outer membrane protein [Winogradskyella immobilis]|uniref:RagB/SusD family nutrient uptake outer membrane protein n=1 Tax=Winogradskyella immobilis TaxID=2816852 RepID=A0ABS8EL46_9FLAO|nr:RagB/SusD family nutrient uptake outer membrane protein [Winogradskyella immobilis]MCC1483940.1 RagB/SusD family nutrient uptake outer membrane protein [Winogradskyella immobilis]MCG0016033.1 RagB/SusD family nutrient uptake outer membrane protein [Winogradskyella immobilis]
MKKINKIIFVGLLAVLMGCNDAIDIRQPGRLDAANAFTNVEDLQLGLLGIYAQWDLTPEIALASNFCDEVSIGFDSGGQGLALYGFQLNPASAAGSNFWVRNFAFNNRASILIEAANSLSSEIDAADQAEFNNILAQAHFLRAYANHELLLYFSTDVRDDSTLAAPVIDFVPGLTFQPLRDTTGDLWAYINSDLDLASSLSNVQSDVTFISRDAITAFRARLAMERGDYPTAASLAQGLLNSYPIADRDQYQLMFLDADNTEIIMKLERTPNDPFDGQGATGSVNAGGWAGARFAFVDATLAGSPYFEMDRNVFNMLDPADIRFDVNVAPTSVISGDFDNDPDPVNNDILVIQKYPGSEGQPLMNDLKAFRSSEMLLILAESRAAMGNFSGAAELIQQLRTARFGSAQPLPVYNSMQEAFAGVLDERRVELVFEGHRYKDLKRIGVAAGRGIDRNMIDCLGQGNACTLSADDFRFTLPIPIVEINGNPAIGAEQNPGY